MVLTLIALAAVGFFFPPAWLILAGFVVYLLASRRSRRDDAVESRVRLMIEQNRQTAEFDELYFEAARSFAIAKGAQSPEQHAASARVIINNRSYSLTFMRGLKNGTIISVRTTASVDAELERDLNERLKKSHSASHRNQSETEPKEFVDAFFNDMNSDTGLDFSELDDKPSFIHDKEKLSEFIRLLILESARRAIPESYTASMCLNKTFLNILLACVARAENAGLGETDQRKIGLEFLARAWDQLNENSKATARSIPINDESLQAILETAESMRREEM